MISTTEKYHSFSNRTRLISLPLNIASFVSITSLLLQQKVPLQPLCSFSFPRLRAANTTPLMSNPCIACRSPEAGQFDLRSYHALRQLPLQDGFAWSP